MQNVVQSPNSNISGQILPT